jgi:hypothetical protein
MVHQQQQIDIEEQCNDVVAQSDYEAALAAIESTFDKFQVSHRRHENENLDHALDQELIEEIYRAAKTSLLDNVKRAVRPINDNDYNDYVEQYHIILEEESENDNNDVDLNPKNEESDGEEEEIDNEELIDLKAWKDAQELRTRIRTMSNTVQGVRERVLKRTEDGILSSVSKHLIDKPIEIIFNDADDSNNETSASNDKENSVQGSKNIVGNNNSSIDSSALQDSLRDLSKILQDPKWKRLPNRIQYLQETIETVRKETTEDRVMSQTEIAITSQYSNTIIESSRQKILEVDCEQDQSSSDNNSTSTINAMDRLALFGQLFS